MSRKRTRRSLRKKEQRISLDKGIAEPFSLSHSAHTHLRWGLKSAVVFAGCLIALATLAAFSNSFTGAFVLDDLNDIVDNASIRHLWPIWDVFVIPSAGRIVLHSRPVVNLSLAINYAIGGLNPLVYHLTNVSIHILAGLTLFGIVRRTLLLPSLAQRFATAATPLALVTALIWSLHPLQTGAVTYVVQRYESLMGLFYFSALYAAIRCATSVHARRWAAATVAASLLSMGSKEVAVSIPLTIILYDRAFLAGSFRAAWSQRRGLYVGLIAAWIAFILLFIFSGSRSQWAGYDLPVSWIEYARSQFGVILHYLRLSFWPHPLVLDYGWPVARTVGEILPGLLVIGGLVAATVYALIRWPKWGFLGAWFFLILAPTSSVMPIADLAFEHRMHLPLAAMITGVVLSGYFLGQRLVRRGILSPLAATPAGVFLVICVATVLGIVTFYRNADYRSELSIYQDTIDKAPTNPRVHNNLGIALGQQGRFTEAITHYQKALEINLYYADAYNNLAWILATCPEASFRNGANAIELAERAVKLSGRQSPNFLDTLAAAYAEAGRFPEAARTIQEAISLAKRQGKATLAESLTSNLRLYESKTPLRERPKRP